MFNTTSRHQVDMCDSNVTAVDSSACNKDGGNTDPKQNCLQTNPPSSFTIPKIQRCKMDLLYEVSSSSYEYQQDILPSIQKTFYYKTSAKSFIFNRIFMVHNADIMKKFAARRKSMKMLGYTDKELSEGYGFLKVNPSDVHEICQNGLKVGNSKTSVLGNPEMGIQISRHADVLPPKPVSYHKGSLIMFKFLKGKVKTVAENQTGVHIDPSPNYDCHMSKTVLSETRNFLPQQIFDTSQIYLYEYVDCNLEDYPSQLLPYAVVEFEFRDPRPPQIIALSRSLPQGSSSSSVVLSSQSGSQVNDEEFVTWNGRLGIKGTFFCRAILVSTASYFKPTRLGTTINITNRSDISKAENKYLGQLTAVRKNEEGYWRGRYINICELRPQFENDLNFKNIVTYLNKKNSMAVIKPDPNTDLLLLPECLLSQHMGISPPNRQLQTVIHCIFLSRQSAKLKSPKYTAQIYKTTGEVIGIPDYENMSRKHVSITSPDSVAFLSNVEASHQIPGETLILNKSPQITNIPTSYFHKQINCGMTTLASNSQHMLSSPSPLRMNPVNFDYDQGFTPTASAIPTLQVSKMQDNFKHQFINYNSDSAMMAYNAKGKRVDPRLAKQSKMEVKQYGSLPVIGEIMQNNNDILNISKFGEAGNGFDTKVPTTKAIYVEFSTKDANQNNSYPQPPQALQDHTNTGSNFTMSIDELSPIKGIRSADDMKSFLNATVNREEKKYTQCQAQSPERKVNTPSCETGKTTEYSVGEKQLVDQDNNCCSIIFKHISSTFSKSMTSTPLSSSSLELLHRKLSSNDHFDAIPACKLEINSVEENHLREKDCSQNSISFHCNKKFANSKLEDNASPTNNNKSCLCLTEASTCSCPLKLYADNSLLDTQNKVQHKWNANEIVSFEDISITMLKMLETVELDVCRDALLSCNSEKDFTPDGASLTPEKYHKKKLPEINENKVDECYESLLPSSTESFVNKTLQCKDIESRLLRASDNLSKKACEGDKFLDISTALDKKVCKHDNTISSTQNRDCKNMTPGDFDNYTSDDAIHFTSLSSRVKNDCMKEDNVKSHAIHPTEFKTTTHANSETTHIDKSDCNKLVLKHSSLISVSLDKYSRLCCSSGDDKSLFGKSSNRMQCTKKLSPHPKDSDILKTFSNLALTFPQSNDDTSDEDIHLCNVRTKENSPPSFSKKKLSSELTYESNPLSVSHYLKLINSKQSTKEDKASCMSVSDFGQVEASKLPSAMQNLCEMYTDCSDSESDKDSFSEYYVIDEVYSDTASDMCDSSLVSHSSHGKLRVQKESVLMDSERKRKQSSENSTSKDMVNLDAVVTNKRRAIDDKSLNSASPKTSRNKDTSCPDIALPKELFQSKKTETLSSQDASAMKSLIDVSKIDFKSPNKNSDASKNGIFKNISIDLQKKDAEKSFCPKTSSPKKTQALLRLSSKSQKAIPVRISNVSNNNTSKTSFIELGVKDCTNLAVSKTSTIKIPLSHRRTESEKTNLCESLSSSVVRTKHQLASKVNKSNSPLKVKGLVLSSKLTEPNSPLKVKKTNSPSKLKEPALSSKVKMSKSPSKLKGAILPSKVKESSSPSKVMQTKLSCTLKAGQKKTKMEHKRSKSDGILLSSTSSELKKNKPSSKANTDTLMIKDSSKEPNISSQKLTPEEIKKVKEINRKLFQKDKSSPQKNCFTIPKISPKKLDTALMSNAMDQTKLMKQIDSSDRNIETTLDANLKSQQNIEERLLKISEMDLPQDESKTQGNEIQGKSSCQSIGNRKARQFHPYNSPKKIKKKQWASFNLAISDLQELMQDLTSSTYQGTPRVESKNCHRRFLNYSFQRSVVPSVDECEKVYKATPDDMEIFEEKRKLADMIEAQFTDERKLFTDEDLIYEEESEIYSAPYQSESKNEDNETMKVAELCKTDLQAETVEELESLSQDGFDLDPIDSYVSMISKISDIDDLSNDDFPTSSSSKQTTEQAKDKTNLNITKKSGLIKTVENEDVRLSNSINIDAGASTSIGKEKGKSHSNTYSEISVDPDILDIHVPDDEDLESWLYSDQEKESPESYASKTEEKSENRKHSFIPISFKRSKENRQDCAKISNGSLNEKESSLENFNINKKAKEPSKSHLIDLNDTVKSISCVVNVNKKCKETSNLQLIDLNDNDQKNSKSLSSNLNAGKEKKIFSEGADKQKCTPIVFEHKSSTSVELTSKHKNVIKRTDSDEEKGKKALEIPKFDKSSDKKETNLQNSSSNKTDKSTIKKHISPIIFDLNKKRSKSNIIKAPCLNLTNIFDISKSIGIFPKENNDTNELILKKISKNQDSSTQLAETRKVSKGRIADGILSVDTTFEMDILSGSANKGPLNYNIEPLIKKSNSSVMSENAYVKTIKKPMDKHLSTRTSGVRNVDKNLNGENRREKNAVVDENKALSKLAEKNETLRKDSGKNKKLPKDTEVNKQLHKDKEKYKELLIDNEKNREHPKVGGRNKELLKLKDTEKSKQIFKDLEENQNTEVKKGKKLPKDIEKKRNLHKDVGKIKDLPKSVEKIPNLHKDIEEYKDIETPKDNQKNIELPNDMEENKEVPEDDIESNEKNKNLHEYDKQSQKLRENIDKNKESEKNKVPPKDNEEDKKLSKELKTKKKQSITEMQPYGSPNINVCNDGLPNCVRNTLLEYEKSQKAGSEALLLKQHSEERRNVQNNQKDQTNAGNKDVIQGRSLPKEDKTLVDVNIQSDKKKYPSNILPVEVIEDIETMRHLLNSDIDKPGESKTNLFPKLIPIHVPEIVKTTSSLEEKMKLLHHEITIKPLSSNLRQRSCDLSSNDDHESHDLIKDGLNSSMYLLSPKSNRSTQVKEDHLSFPFSRVSSLKNIAQGQINTSIGRKLSVNKQNVVSFLQIESLEPRRLKTDPSPATQAIMKQIWDTNDVININGTDPRKALVNVVTENLKRNGDTSIPKKRMFKVCDSALGLKNLAQSNSNTENNQSKATAVKLKVDGVDKNAKKGSSEKLRESTKKNSYGLHPRRKDHWNCTVPKIEFVSRNINYEANPYLDRYHLIMFEQWSVDPRREIKSLQNAQVKCPHTGLTIRKKTNVQLQFDQSSSKIVIQNLKKIDSSSNDNTVNRILHQSPSKNISSLCSIHPQQIVGGLKRKALSEVDHTKNTSKVDNPKAQKTTSDNPLKNELLRYALDSLSPKPGLSEKEKIILPPFKSVLNNTLCSATSKELQQKASDININHKIKDICNHSNNKSVISWKDTEENASSKTDPFPFASALATSQESRRTPKNSDPHSITVNDSVRNVEPLKTISIPKIFKDYSNMFEGFDVKDEFNTKSNHLKSKTFSHDRRRGRDPDLNNDAAPLNDLHSQEGSKLMSQKRNDGNVTDSGKQKTNIPQLSKKKSCRQPKKGVSCEDSNVENYLCVTNDLNVQKSKFWNSSNAKKSKSLEKDKSLTKSNLPVKVRNKVKNSNKCCNDGVDKPADEVKCPKRKQQKSYLKPTAVVPPINTSHPLKFFNQKCEMNTLKNGEIKGCKDENEYEKCLRNLNKSVKKVRNMKKSEKRLKRKSVKNMLSTVHESGQVVAGVLRQTRHTFGSPKSTEEQSKFCQLFNRTVNDVKKSDDLRVQKSTQQKAEGDAKNDGFWKIQVSRKLECCEEDMTAKRRRLNNQIGKYDINEFCFDMNLPKEVQAIKKDRDVPKKENTEVSIKENREAVDSNLNGNNLLHTKSASHCYQNIEHSKIHHEFGSSLSKSSRLSENPCGRKTKNCQQSSVDQCFPTGPKNISVINTDKSLADRTHHLSSRSCWINTKGIHVDTRECKTSTTSPFLPHDGNRTDQFFNNRNMECRPIKQGTMTHLETCQNITVRFSRVMNELVCNNQSRKNMDVQNVIPYTGRIRYAHNFQNQRGPSIGFNNNFQNQRGPSIVQSIFRPMFQPISGNNLSNMLPPNLMVSPSNFKHLTRSPSFSAPSQYNSSRFDTNIAVGFPVQEVQQSADNGKDEERPLSRNPVFPISQEDFGKHQRDSSIKISPSISPPNYMSPFIEERCITNLLMIEDSFTLYENIGVLSNLFSRLASNGSWMMLIHDRTYFQIREWTMDYVTRSSILDSIQRLSLISGYKHIDRIKLVSQCNCSKDASHISETMACLINVRNLYYSNIRLSVILADYLNGVQHFPHDDIVITNLELFLSQIYKD